MIAVGRQASPRPPPARQSPPAFAGNWLMPALTDTHVHFSADRLPALSYGLEDARYASVGAWFSPRASEILAGR